MSARDLLRSLFVYQAWANGELLEKLAGLDQRAHPQERHAAIRLLNHNLIVSRIFAGASFRHASRLRVRQHRGHAGAR